jgi:catechol-2,3-dioxygenase
MSDIASSTACRVHHLKLQVRDLERCRPWYSSRLGYQVALEFEEDGQLMGYAKAPCAAHA